MSSEAVLVGHPVVSHDECVIFGGLAWAECFTHLKRAYVL